MSERACLTERDASLTVCPPPPPPSNLIQRETVWRSDWERQGTEKHLTGSDSTRAVLRNAAEAAAQAPGTVVNYQWSIVTG